MAVIPLVSPHKLLVLDKGFCDLFGYSASGRSEAEICGLAIKSLHGPRTDPAATTCGINNCAAGFTMRVCLVLYDPDGREIGVDATFSPTLPPALWQVPLFLG